MVAVAQRLTRLAGDRRVTRRDEWAVAFFGTWMVFGLFLDGWAHGANKPETFFSPWHGVLYSGFLAAMAFGALDGFRSRTQGEVVRMERLSLAGIALFGAGGVGDMVWHEIFGIEVDLEALLSPTHLLLMSGGLLMATAPLRAAWSDPDDERRTSSLRTFLPTVASLTLAIAIVSFFSMYVSAFDGFVLSDELRGDGATVHLVASMFVTITLFVVPMLLVLRRWQPPTGTFTLTFGAVSVAMSGLDGFDRWPLIAAGIAAGIVADVLLRRRAPLRLVAVAVPFSFSALWFEVFDHVYGLGLAPEIWTGTIALVSLAGLGLSYVAFPPALPDVDRNRVAVS